MSEVPRVWMMPPFGAGEPKDVAATPDVIVPMMVAGWQQCAPPLASEEETTNVHD